MPQLYFTDIAALRRPAIVDGVTYELTAEAIAVAAPTGLSDGMPKAVVTAAHLEAEATPGVIYLPPEASAT
jgi:hypothetical protein